MCCDNVRNQLCPNYNDLPHVQWNEQTPIDEPNFRGIFIADGKYNSHVCSIGVTLSWLLSFDRAKKCMEKGGQVLIAGNDNLDPHHPANCNGKDNMGRPIQSGNCFIKERGIYFIADIVEIIHLPTLRTATGDPISNKMENQIFQHHCNESPPLSPLVGRNAIAIFFENPTEQRCFSNYITFPGIAAGYIGC